MNGSLEAADQYTCLAGRKTGGNSHEFKYGLCAANSGRDHVY
jgi:hypothetical protein